MRTPAGGGPPNGVGCVRQTFTTTRATPIVYDTTGRDIPYAMPIQVIATNTSSVPIVLCWSQDSSPIINLQGTFTDDPLNPRDSTQKGSCQVVAASSPGTFIGITAEDFGPFAAGYKPGTCDVTKRPCSVLQDCTAAAGSGDSTCSLTSQSNYTYLFAISQGSANRNLYVCEAR